MWKKRTKNDKGFSLLEIMAVLSVVSIGMIGISSLVIQNIQAQNINHNYLIASMLTQEGLELVRNIRDDNWLKGDVYDLDISDDIADGANRYLVIDYYGRTNIDYIVTGIADVNAKLFLDGLGFYSQPPGADITPFSRVIYIDKDASGNFIMVRAEVQWKERGRVHSYKAETKLYDWR